MVIILRNSRFQYFLKNIDVQNTGERHLTNVRTLPSFVYQKIARYNVYFDKVCVDSGKVPFVYVNIYRREDKDLFLLDTVISY